MRKTMLSALLLLCACVAVAAQDISELKRETLRGLQGFIVDVEGFNEQSTSLRSASQSQVQTDVELRVRKAGIQLSTENEWPNSLYHPAIIVNLRLFSLEKPLEDVYTYNITVKVMQ